MSYHAFRHLLGRADASIAVDQGAGAPVPAPTPQASPLMTSAPVASNGAPDIVYSFGTYDPTFYDITTGQPVNVYVSDGYVPLLLNGNETGMAPVVSQSLQNLINSVRPRQDNRGNVFFPDVYASAAALAAYQAPQTLYMAPVAGYVPTTQAPAPSSAIPAPAANAAANIINTLLTPSADDGRQRIPDRPISLVNNPAPLAPVVGGQGWTSDDGATAPADDGSEAPATQAGGRGWLLLAAIAAAVLSR